MQYDSDTNNIEKEIEDVNEKLTSTTGLVKKSWLRNKIIETENIPGVTGSVTTTAFNTKVTEIENQIPDINSSGYQSCSKYKRRDWRCNYDRSHLINTQKFNKLTEISFDARIKEAGKRLACNTEVKDALYLRI